VRQLSGYAFAGKIFFIEAKHQLHEYPYINERVPDESTCEYSERDHGTAVWVQGVTWSTHVGGRACNSGHVISWCEDDIRNDIRMRYQMARMCAADIGGAEWVPGSLVQIRPRQEGTRR